MQTTPASDASAAGRADAPVASIVVATKNRRDRLSALLRALERQTVPAASFEVIVVDDGSTDATPDLLATAAEHGPLELHTFRQDVSAGPAAARNRGWRAAKASLIAFTDDDCEPVAEWLETLLTTAAGASGAIVQGRTLPNPAEAERMNSFARSLEVAGPSPHYPTANILYPRDLLEQLGGFDEQYGAPAGEDTDLGWRARAAGAETVFAPAALVHHAVHDRGPMNTLRDALRAADCVKPYRDHPELRAHLSGGLFFDQSHPLLAQAVIAAWAARRSPVAAVLALPYLVYVLRRTRAAGSPARHAPFLVVRDIVEVFSTVQGAVRHRAPVL
jgi:glycosyltransferase involved in cell wall biosynthesis